MTDWTTILHGADQLCFHTGNVGAWKELQRRSFANPSEELIECMKFLVGQDVVTNGNNGVIRSLDLYSPYCTDTGNDVERYPREDLKITLKIFLSKPDAAEITESLLVIKNELQVNFVDQLIVSLPPSEPDELNVHPSDSSKLLLLWPCLENLVAEGHVAALGAADLDVDDLRRLWEGAKLVKPLVNHHYTTSCCSVSSELKDYAKQRNVILLTHSDPNPFIDTDQLENVFAEVPTTNGKNFLDEWSVEWIAKYIAMVKTRSVIASKGYVVKFKKNN